MLFSNANDPVDTVLIEIIEYSDILDAIMTTKHSLEFWSLI